MSRRALTALAAPLLALACGGEPAPEPQAKLGEPWQPGVVHRSTEGTNARGLLDLRGLIHAHSVYSHDACDDEPRDANDAIKQDCFADFRRGLCQTAHDFVFLTDHTESFARTEFPEVLLYRPDQGDQLVERGGAPVASWLACPDAPPALVLAGNEGALMPVGLERHVAPEIAQRKAIYGGTSAQQMEAMSAAGAVVLAQHTEDWTPEQLATLPFGGFEMYNLHANTITGAGGLVGLLGKLKSPELLPHPDLTLLPIINEDARYLERWGSVLATGARRLTTIGTDCHQNTLAKPLPDGERMDSYRRMMLWMSIHLLVRPSADGGWADVELKAALSARGCTGSSSCWGTPIRLSRERRERRERDGRERQARGRRGASRRFASRATAGRAERAAADHRTALAGARGRLGSDRGGCRRSRAFADRARRLPRRDPDPPAAPRRMAVELRRARGE
jgi:hypothetical protein